MRRFFAAALTVFLAAAGTAGAQTTVSGPVTFGTVFSVSGAGTVSIAGGGVTNAMLANSGLTLGSTALTLGGTVTSVSGLTLSGATLSGTTALPGGGTITSAGALGIGTSSLGSSQLVVVGIAGAAAIAKIGDGTRTLGIYTATGGSAPVQIGNISNHNLGFFTNNGAPALILNTSGGLGLGTPTDPGAGNLIVSGVFEIAALTTWTDTQTCAAGQITWDASFLYACTATNTVKRAALSTF